MPSRAAVVVIVTFISGAGIYFSLFMRQSVDNILASNEILVRPFSTSEVDDLDDEFSISHRTWDSWMARLSYIGIGNIFNKCNSTKRLSIGRVVMVPDEIKGGVTSRTFINMTLEEDVTSGKLYVTCEYGGKTLYTSKWDLCSMEEGEKEAEGEAEAGGEVEGEAEREGSHKRTFACPITKGRKTFVKQMKIPNYLPKGFYETKVRIVDQAEREIGCVFVAFSL